MEIYHVSYESGLKQITNDKFSARKWTPESYPHKVLISEFSRKLDSESIYRVCFWSNYSDAVNASKKEFGGKKNVILKFEYNDLVALGFNDSQDDGFPNQNVHLFWIKENTAPSSFSDAGVPFNKISIEVDGLWECFDNYMSKCISTNSITELGSKLPITKKTWWSFR